MSADGFHYFWLSFVKKSKNYVSACLYEITYKLFRKPPFYFYFFVLKTVPKAGHNVPTLKKIDQCEQRKAGTVDGAFDTFLELVFSKKLHYNFYLEQERLKLKSHLRMDRKYGFNFLGLQKTCSSGNPIS
jgi:hypothetical protein